MNVRVVVASVISASRADIMMSALKAERVKPKRVTALGSWVVRAKARHKAKTWLLDVGGCVFV